MLVGEIGGDEEEKAARYVAEHMSKPVFAYIAGFSAPPGKTMGHAGAIISGSSGTAQAKKEALEAAGIAVGTTPTEVAQLVADGSPGLRSQATGVLDSWTRSPSRAACPRRSACRARSSPTAPAPPLERDGKTILSYGSGGGYGPLRELIAEWHDVPIRNGCCSPNGALQGFVFLAQRLGAGQARASSSRRPTTAR